MTKIKIRSICLDLFGLDRNQCFVKKGISSWCWNPAVISFYSHKKSILHLLLIRILVSCAKKPSCMGKMWIPDHSIIGQGEHTHISRQMILSHSKSTDDSPVSWKCMKLNAFLFFLFYLNVLVWIESNMYGFVDNFLKPKKYQ